PVFGSGTTVPLRSEGSASRATGITATRAAMVVNGTWSGEVAVVTAQTSIRWIDAGFDSSTFMDGTVTVMYTSLPTRRAAVTSAATGTRTYGRRGGPFFPHAAVVAHERR